MNQTKAALSILGVLLIFSCSCGATSPGPTYTEIQEGTGPCNQGINLSIEGKQYFVPLTLLSHTTVGVDGVQREAIALTELLPAPVLAPHSFEGKFTTDQLRLLYDCRLAGEQAGSAQISVAPESMATGYLLVEGRSVYLKDDATSRQVQGVCRVDALRRMLITRGTVSKGVHVAELPTEPYTDQRSQTASVTFKDLVAASGLLAEGEKLTQLDYRLVPVDYLEKKDKAVRFPWGHSHLASLRWVPSLGRTRSVDTTGDLKDGSGAVAHHGVAGEGWSSIKGLLEVVMEPAPDAAHTTTGPDGLCTDPASCLGCHKVGGVVVIPVTCTQCHPR